MGASSKNLEAVSGKKNSFNKYYAHILLGRRTKFCQPSYGAAYGRRRDQDERFNRARAQEQEARGTGRHRAFGGIPPRRSPVELLAGLAGWRRVVGHESDRPHRTGKTERAPSAGLLGCVCACVAAGLNLGRRKKRPLRNYFFRSPPGKSKGTVCF
jgi:hypothetical protein